MSKLVDATVPILCGECDNRYVTKWEDGISAMIKHVLAAHPEYTEQEAVDTVRHWADDSYERIENEEYEHAQEHKRGACDCAVDDVISADAFPNK